MNTQNNTNNYWVPLFLSWLVATISTLGSLFFSEVMELIPCVLCWYQRIFMFPLVFVLFTGLLTSDKRAVDYALPIVIVGFAFAVYHSLLFYGFIPQGLQPCGQGASCSDEKNMVIFGILPIPLLSLASFSLIILLLFKSKVST